MTPNVVSPVADGHAAGPGWAAKWIVVFLSALLLLGIVPSASSNHIVGTYGSRGYHWLATNYDYAEEWVTSNYCTTAELDAFTRVRNSTAGTSQFAGRWPSGLRLVRVSCDGVVDITIDIKLEYSDFCVTHGCGTYGGENHSFLASSSYCAFWGVRYPCGSHPSIVHVNKPKYLNTSSLGRQRLHMHETGHSQGLSEHCTSDAIMNNGVASCNGGRWLEVMSYLATDRSGVRSVYPNWPYP
jgi:hypothetical protein